jgi:hypothetical protein
LIQLISSHLFGVELDVPGKDTGARIMVEFLLCWCYEISAQIADSTVLVLYVLF